MSFHAVQTQAALDEVWLAMQNEQLSLLDLNPMAPLLCSIVHGHSGIYSVIGFYYRFE